jgi:heterodisulfide reductase subunit A
MNDEPRIGVYICNCGTNIAKVVDAERVRDRVAELPGVACARTYKYMCSNPGQDMITQDIRENGLDRVVVAACSPRMHEPTFRKALEAAGLNPYMLEMANIREQCSWVHDDPAKATAKAADLTHAAVRRVARHQPLEKQEAPYTSATMVLGGGIAGLTVAVELADAGQKVHLIEREGRLGGNVGRVDLTAPYLDSARDLLAEKIIQAETSPRIDIHLRSTLTDLQGFVGNFTGTVTHLDGSDTQMPVGSVVVCTGYHEFDATRIERLGYGKHVDVITSFELEQRLRAGRLETADGRVPRYVSIVHCVGSRNPKYHPYCSRVCCMTALKYGHEIKSALPGAMITDLYVDMLSFGKGGEDLYRRTSELKTMFLMFEKEDYPVVRKAEEDDDCGMLVQVQERLSGETIDVPADLVVLMVGMQARSDSGQVARTVGISQDVAGWFIESHPKLAPVSTSTEGVFIAGCCQSPKDIPDSVAQARAAAAMVLGYIARGKVEVDARFAKVDEELCSGCRICNELCPYTAIAYDPEEGRSDVQCALCKACGTCVAACPSGAITARHFTDEQILEQIEGVLAWSSSQP